MKKIHFLLVYILSYSLAVAHIRHNVRGTDYSIHGVDAYAKSKHGADGALFLDPFFLSFFRNIENLKLLDAGCGAGPWSIIAAKNGAFVCGIDLQKNMISHAKKNAQEHGVQTKTQFLIGSVSELPYTSDFFERAISINLGCNLPQDVFKKHFKELYRCLKPGGKLVVTAPASFDMVFRHNSDLPLKSRLEKALCPAENDSPESVVENLSRFSDVLRATFVKRDNGFMLVEDEKELQEGEYIWRKIPGLVVPNYYHSEKSYIKELLHAGFEIEQIDRPRFKSLDDWKKSKKNLSKEYLYYHPFVIFHAVKP